MLHPTFDAPLGYTNPAWKGAFFINGQNEARKWLGRKGRNMKTEDRTHPMIKDLLQALNLERPGRTRKQQQSGRTTLP